jgi:hypothetical protein
MKNILLLSMFMVCALHQYLAQENYSKVDYAQTENWAVLPGKYPSALFEFGSMPIFDSIDVFYCYPTLIAGKDDKRWNVPIEDSLQRERVIQEAIKFQASAWSMAGNVYVPYYRQAHLRSYYELENGGREALLLAYSDVRDAFSYYLEHYNKGKGIILAGHSQGSTHLSFILRDFFDGKDLQRQLVAAYIPGIGIDSNSYATIPLLKQPAATGGFLAWNTFKRKFDEKQYVFYKGKAVINPVSWDGKKVSNRGEHKGFLFRNGKIYKRSFATHVDDGVIWITIPHFPYRFMAFSMSNYHVGDINLFWEDIRSNAILRTKSYVEKK